MPGKSSFASQCKSGRDNYQQATHLRYFPAFTTLVQKVDEALLHFANLPAEVLALMAHYCESLGTATA